MRDISFFRASIGIILAPAAESGNLFIKMTRKTENGSFEKFSKGQGRNIALSVQEISQAIIQLENEREFSAFHRSPSSGIQTQIRFLPKQNELEIRLEDYVFSLNPAEKRIFCKLLEKTEDAILSQIVMGKQINVLQGESSHVSPTENRQFMSKTPKQPFSQEIKVTETHGLQSQEMVPMDSNILTLIREQFQGEWILGRMLEKLGGLDVNIQREELLAALDILLQENFITKDQRTAKAGHTYFVYNFPSDVV